MSSIQIKQFFYFTKMKLNFQMYGKIPKSSGQGLITICNSFSQISKNMRHVFFAICIRFIDHIPFHVLKPQVLPFLFYENLKKSFSQQWFRRKLQTSRSFHFLYFLFYTVLSIHHLIILIHVMLFQSPMPTQTKLQQFHDFRWKI